MVGLGIGDRDAVAVAGVVVVVVVGVVAVEGVGVDAVEGVDAGEGVDVERCASDTLATRNAASRACRNASTFTLRLQCRHI